MEMERLWLAVFPSIIVAFFIHRAIVNNIPGMRRVFGGNLIGNRVSFAEIWEWLVTPQNLMTKPPLVKLTVAMDGSLSGLELTENNFTQGKNKIFWNSLLAIDLFGILYYQYWKLGARENKYLANSSSWANQLNHLVKNMGRINTGSLSFWGITIILGNLLLAGIMTALHVPSIEERLLVGKVIGFELILILNLLMWICLKGVIRDKLRVGNKLINSTAMGKLKLIQLGKVGFFSAIILLILLNLQISNLFQKLHKEVREEKIWALNPRRAQRQHDLGQAWNCRQPLELADRVHMEGKTATQ